MNSYQPRDVKRRWVPKWFSLLNHPMLRSCLYITTQSVEQRVLACLRSLRDKIRRPCRYCSSTLQFCSLFISQWKLNEITVMCSVTRVISDERGFRILCRLQLSDFVFSNIEQLVVTVVQSTVRAMKAITNFDTASKFILETGAAQYEL